MIQAENKRKFLIVCANKVDQDNIKTLIENNISNSQCLTACDGADAISKIQNDPPDIVITEPGLSKTSGFKLTTWILKKKADMKVAIILLCTVPNSEQFVDEVVISQVQFCDPTTGEINLKKSIVKALNFLSHLAPQEFYLRFLTAGDVLVKEGDKADNVYLLKKGELVATTMTKDNVITLGRIAAGEFVGEMAYINGEPRSATVEAKTDCELIEIPISLLDTVLFTKPSWSKALMKTLSKRVKITNQKMAATK